MEYITGGNLLRFLRKHRRYELYADQPSIDNEIIPSAETAEVRHADTATWAKMAREMSFINLSFQSDELSMEGVIVPFEINEKIGQEGDVDDRHEDSFQQQEEITSKNSCEKNEEIREMEMNLKVTSPKTGDTVLCDTERRDDAEQSFKGNGFADDQKQHHDVEFPNNSQTLQKTNDPGNPALTTVSEHLAIQRTNPSDQKQDKRLNSDINNTEEHNLKSGQIPKDSYKGVNSGSDESHRSADRKPSNASSGNSQTSFISKQEVGFSKRYIFICKQCDEVSKHRNHFK